MAHDQDESIADRAIANVVWNHLGVRDPKLLEAWFKQLYNLADCEGGGQMAMFAVKDGPVTWEDVK